MYMKKILLLLMACTTFAACSDDDKGTAVENDYVSSVLINGQPFEPTPKTTKKSYVTTSVAYGGPDIAERSLILIKHDSNPGLREVLSVNLRYSGTDASGTYTLFSGGAEPSDGLIGGVSYQKGDNYH